MNAQSKIETATLASAMALAFAEIEAATKSATNPHFKSKYADLGSIIEAIKPPLIKHRLFFTQRCLPAEDGVSVETVLHHTGGEKESLGTLYVPANKRDPQGFGSALTYARRYALQTAFGVPTEDDDGNAATRSAPQQTARTAPKAIAASDNQRDLIQTLATASGKTLQQICEAYKVESLKDLTHGQAEAVIARLTPAKEPVNA